MKRGRCPGEGWGALGGFVQLTRGKRRVRGRRGKMWSAWKGGGQVLPLPVPPSPSQTYYSWVWDALYLAAEAKPCLKIKAQSS